MMARVQGIVKCGEGKKGAAASRGSPSGVSLRVYQGVGTPST